MNVLVVSMQISPDEEEIFFHDPAQLLSAYQALEESNLFYIQNAQVRGALTMWSYQCCYFDGTKRMAERASMKRSGSVVQAP